jgi:7,8-dihydropterin-6-yl-methyl-4-(beta-D-ribofuranosyl)aminobenzene 5'-phosphate synthase
VISSGATVLFDTGGDASVLLANMRRVGLDPGAVQAIVISHVHADHLGGLEGFLAENSDVTVYVPASFSASVRRMIEASGATLVETAGPAEIAPDIVTTGPLRDGPDEQALVIDTQEGLVVMTGCAHPGIVRVVETVRAQGNRPIALVMGGFHLSGASSSEVARIIRDLRRLGVRRVAPSHCTGDAARRQFEEVYGPDYVAEGAGMVLTLAAADAADGPASPARR